MTHLKTITVRSVDENVYKDVKIRCAIREYPMGLAITEAMELWLKSKNEKVVEHPL